MRRAQADLPRCASKGIFDLEHDPGAMVVAAPRGVGRTTIRKPTRAAHTAEQFGEEVGKTRFLTSRKAVTRVLEIGVPIRWRSELLARSIAASELVVGGTLLRVGQYGMRLVDFLHARFGVWLL